MKLFNRQSRQRAQNSLERCRRAIATAPWTRPPLAASQVRSPSIRVSPLPNTPKLHVLAPSPPSRAPHASPSGTRAHSRRSGARPVSLKGFSARSPSRSRAAPSYTIQTTQKRRNRRRRACPSTSVPCTPRSAARRPDLAGLPPAAGARTNAYAKPCADGRSAAGW